MRISHASFGPVDLTGALERKAKSAKWLRSHRFSTESCALSQMKNVQRSAQWFQDFHNDYISAKWFCSQLFLKKRVIRDLTRN